MPDGVRNLPRANLISAARVVRRLECLEPLSISAAAKRLWSEFTTHEHLPGLLDQKKRNAVPPVPRNDGWTTTMNIYVQVGLVTFVGLVAKRDPNLGLTHQDPGAWRLDLLLAKQQKTERLPSQNMNVSRSWSQRWRLVTHSEGTRIDGAGAR